MGRVQLEMPESYIYSTIIPIKITDVNYGNHLGNDKVLSFVHEARVRFLNHFDCTELDLGSGVSIIMGDAAIEFKSEGFYGDQIEVKVQAMNFSSRSFEIYYQLENLTTGKILAKAKTGIVCFNYQTRSTEAVPETFKQHFF